MPAESQSNNTLGFKRLSSGETLCAALSSRRGEVRLQELWSEKKGAIDKRFSSYLPIGALPASAALVRQIEIPLKRERDLNSVLAFQVEPLLPYPIEDGLLDRILLERGEGKSRLTFLAVKESALAEHLEASEIDPELLSVESVSLAHFSYLVTGSLHPLFAVYIDEESTQVVAAEGGKLLASHTFDLGVDEALSQEMKQRLQQAIMSLTKQLGKPLMRQIVVASIKPQESYAAIIPPHYSAFAIKPLQGHSKEALERFAIPIGSAMNGLLGCKASVNFRTGPFAPPNPWKRLKKGLFTYYALTCTIALSLFLFGKAYIYHEKGALMERWVEQLTALNKDPQAFEARFREKVLGDTEEIKDLDISSLTLEDLSDRIDFLQKEIQAAPNLFALHPNVPRVSDLLAFLANHPQIRQTPEGQERFKLVSLSYQMVKRPDMSKKQERYQVKVDMEFTTETPKLAREFHDALIAPNDFVDPKGEIKWSTGRGTYRTSFFLKDKTHYPT